MKSFFRCVLVVLALLTAVWRADAQTNLYLYVTNSAGSGTNTFSSLQVSNQLTYSIYVTNLTGFNFSDMLVTNFLVGPVQLVGGSNIYGSIFVFTNGAPNTNIVVFDLGENLSGSIDAVSLTIQAAAAGYITNIITQASFDFTNTISTTLVTQVTNALLTADLGVTVAGPVQQVIAADLIVYGITVTNSGPDPIPGILLTNNLPPDAILLGGSPAQSYDLVTNSTVTNLVFSLGTLAVGSSYNLQLFLEPTNPEPTNILMASVGAPNLVDPNVTNNYASTNIPVLEYVNYLAVSTNLSAPATNDPQTGLTEQSIVISNTNGYTVPAARVVVTGLTNFLANAAGTNGNAPFVYYSAPLHGHETETLLLQFSPRVASLSTNEVLYAFGVPFLPTWTPPASLTNNASLTLNKIIKMPNGNMLVEFPATRGKTYTVVYSDNVEFSNAMMSPPSIVSPANEVQWIDYGPPATVSTPAKGGARFYEVFPNP